MKLSEALRLPPLDAASVVAGQGQIDRDVTWVQVVDHPDIEAWVEAGHLLLSTGYNWPKDGTAAADLIRRLSAKGVCGVVLAVPHFVDHFAAQSIAAAECLGMVLIEIPWEVPFSAITQSIHRELVDRQARALARSEQIHRQLTEAAIAGEGLQDVARVLGGVVGRSVQIHATEGSVLAHFTLARDAIESPSFVPGVFHALAAGGALRAMDAETRAVRWRPRPSRLATQAQSVVGCAVRNRAGLLGYLLVAEGNPPLNEIDLRAVEHAGTVAALQISHQRQLLAQEARLGYALVASLVEGTFEAKPANFERASLLGWDESAPYRMISVLLDEPNPLTNEGFSRRESIAMNLRRAVESKKASALMSLSANQVHALLPEHIDVSWLWKELAAGRSALGVSDLHVGVAGMLAAGREIADLIEHLRPGRMHLYSEAIFPRVLSGDPAARRQFVDRLFGAMGADKRGQNLVETAIALADEGFNLQGAADRLGIHISTLRYRLGKLGDVTGLDLTTVEGRFRLQFGVRLYLAEQA
jgi:purine catabolism regulator